MATIAANQFTIYVPTVDIEIFTAIAQRFSWNFTGKTTPKTTATFNKSLQELKSKQFIQLKNIQNPIAEILQ